MIDPERLRTALSEAEARIADAAQRSGRRPGGVRIVLAGKYVAADQAPRLPAAGVRVSGERPTQDLEAKHAVLGDRVTFDFIGHLQRRKVRRVLPLVRLIHSVDSVDLVREIAARSGGPVRFLVQVNTSDEPTKGGIAPDDLAAFAAAAAEIPDAVIGGLMTLPPRSVRAEDARPYFASLRELRDRFAAEWAGRHDFRDLSMGTSQDFWVAVEEGATRVRIGRAMIDLAQVS